MPDILSIGAFLLARYNRAPVFCLLFTGAACRAATMAARAGMVLDGSARVLRQ
jgi:hypothetical protein